MADEKKDNQDTPKIIVDDDWKTQAAAEKEKLSEEVEHAAPADGAGGGPGGQLPTPSFNTLVGSLVSQAMYALGGMQHPQTGQRYVDLDMAKYAIDTLKVLEEKTKGNLTDEEKKLLDQALYETRMHYVQMAQQA